jgi:hypothetical protein
MKVDIVKHATHPRQVPVPPADFLIYRRAGYILPQGGVRRKPPARGVAIEAAKGFLSGIKAIFGIFISITRGRKPVKKFLNLVSGTLAFTYSLRLMMSI